MRFQAIMSLISIGRGCGVSGSARVETGGMISNRKRRVRRAIFVLFMGEWPPRSNEVVAVSLGALQARKQRLTVETSAKIGLTKFKTRDETAEIRLVESNDLVKRKLQRDKCLRVSCGAFVPIAPGDLRSSTFRKEAQSGRMRHKEVWPTGVTGVTRQLSPSSSMSKPCDTCCDTD